mgnify:CR=1 FL=1
MEFLNAITAQEALEQVRSFPLPEPKSCTVKTEKALGRILAEDITAAEDIPPFPRSLVDGYAVMVKDTYGARETSPSFLYVVGQVRVGESAALPVREGEAVYIATGAMIPEGADGVVMQEYTRQTADAVEVTRPLRKGENIVFAGEDIRKGTTVLSRGTRLGPFDLGVLAALGVTEVEVFPRPRIGLISSGNEIVAIETKTLPPGTVRDINRYTIAGLLEQNGCDVDFLGIASDTIEDISEKLTRAQEYDLVLVEHEVGVRDHHLVAGVEGGHQRQEQSARHARCHDDVLAVDFPSSKIGRQFFSQLGDTPRRGVLVEALLGPVNGGLLDLRRDIEIGFADAQVDGVFCPLDHVEDLSYPGRSYLFQSVRKPHGAPPGRYSAAKLIGRQESRRKGEFPLQPLS